MPLSRTRFRAGCLALPVVLAACSDRMSLESKMHGELETALRLEGPIELQVQMQGPTVRYEGTYISDELFDHVEVNEATDEWVLAVFGEPDARTKLRNGSEIWRWTYRPVEQQAPVVEVFTDSEKEPKLATRTVFVMLRGAVVVEKWKG